MTKLRFLLFEDCNRNCRGCCNNDYDLKALEIETSFNGYDEILLTGGEPMLKPELVVNIAKNIRIQSSAKIYMYTALVDNLGDLFLVLKHIDGITVTLHNQNDVTSFMKLDELLINTNILRHSKIFRLNIFKGINMSHVGDFWKIKSNIEWIKDASLPESEVFKRYSMYYHLLPLGSSRIIRLSKNDNNYL